MTTTILPFIDNCPKSMQLGPCGGVSDNGACEIDSGHACVFLDPVRQPGFEQESTSVLARALPPDETAESTSGFRHALESGRFAIIAEVNGRDGVDVGEFVRAATEISAVADVVSITDHSGANVHMGNVAATAHLLAAGIETMPTFSCRDRNRIALQGDLLGVASLGARNVLCVTGNHVAVGDSHDAKPVFDLDSPRLIAMADHLRKTGTYENGRPLSAAPKLFIGGTAHPFAPPYDERPKAILRKVALGADFIISQHIFDVQRWKTFVAGVNALREEKFFLLGSVAILPDGHTARIVNAGLRGFTIPEDVLKRLDQAKDPQDTGIEIAAETIAMLNELEGVSGSLMAPVTTRGSSALSANLEQRDLIREVRTRAGVSHVG